MTELYLPFPESALDQHMIALGKTRAGKSSKVRVVVEHILDQAKHPITIIDKKGDWYGLKSSANGKEAGYPLVIFGGKHADVPLNPRAGTAVAELLSGGNRSAILDIKGWSGSEQTQFYIDFVSRTFQLQDGGQRYLCVPEVHNFAPKGRVMSPKVGEMLHWTSTLAAEGQGLGLILLLDSQRPQKVHNDVLSACETLIACRVTHTADRGAVKEWIDGNGDPKIGQQMLSELANMPRTDAYVWSPEAEFGPERITWRMFKTFDSFKPRERHQKKLSGWADVDLEEVTNKLSAVIEEHKSNDPAELKREIARLKKELSAGPQAAVPDILGQIRKAEDTAYTQGHTHARQELSQEIRQALDNVLSRPAVPPVPKSWPADIVKGGKSAVITMKTPSGTPVAVAHRVTHSTGEHKLSKAERSILTVLAQYPDGRTKTQIAILTCYAHTGGGFNNALYALRTRQLMIIGSGQYTITPAGLDALGRFDPLPTGAQLRTHWMGQLGKAERAALEVLTEAFPGAVSKEALAKACNYEPTGGGFNNALGKLRSLELIEGRGELRASSDLF
jgi:hypothetical protein